MFNKNVFTQKDPIADLIKGINEADYKAKMEALKGNQHKIDKNHNNKVDADDFKILRGEKKAMKEEEQVEEDTSVKIPTSTGTKVLGHRYGNAAKTHRDSMGDPFAVVRGPKEKDLQDIEKKKVKKEEIDPEKVTTDTLAGRVKGKTGNPFAPKKVMMDVPGDVKEEVEELDELSKSTLGSYAKKATRDARLKHGMGKDFERISKSSRKPEYKAGAKEWEDKYKSDARKREAGVNKAIDRLAKEEVEQLKEFGDLPKIGMTGDHPGPFGVYHKQGKGADDLKIVSKHKTLDSALKHVHRLEKKTGKEHVYGNLLAHKPEHGEIPKKFNEEVELDERELSKGETAEKERIVKGMKKSLAGFKARYGDKAKSVMYATATKAAKNEQKW